MTQEELAAAIGVTSQAVSKWENGSSYPDIEYITPLASFFNVTTDYLFSCDTAEKQRKIDEYCREYDTHNKDWKSPHERVDMMRHALAEFPADEKLLFRLAKTLYYKWCDNGYCLEKRGDYFYYDYEKNKSFDSWEESVKIMEELLNTSSDDEIRSESRWLLAVIYAKVGAKEKTLAIAEKCGDIDNTKISILAAALDGKDEMKYKQLSLLTLISSIRHPFSYLSSLYVKDGDTQIAAAKVIIDLFELIFGGDCGFYHVVFMDLYVDYAKALACLDKADEAFAALESACSHAEKYENIVYEKDGTRKDEIVCYSSPYLDLLDGENPKDFYTSKQMPMLRKSLENESGTLYRKLRDDARYGALIDRIKAHE